MLIKLTGVTPTGKSEVMVNSDYIVVYRDQPEGREGNTRIDLAETGGIAIEETVSEINEIVPKDVIIPK